MTALSDEEIKVLNSHKIRKSELFDAAGLSSEAAYDEMKASEKTIACGTPECGKCGGKLKTRNWHCIECNRAAVAFQKRANATASVYIAASPMNELIKVGVSEDVGRRIEHLNREGYGGASDWRALVSFHSKEAGTVERFLHMKLSPWGVAGSYQKGGRTQQCYELFKCNFSDALKGLRIMSKKKERLIGIKPEAIGKVYEFKV